MERIFKTRYCCFKKYSYEEQVKILIKYYNIVDPTKSDEK